MKTFWEIRESTTGKSLTIFDIDETLFHTTAKISVVDQAGNVIRKLDNQQFNTYKLGAGESFDFGEFKNAELFNKKSQPIRPMLAKLKAIIRNSKGGRIIMLTAREDFDDKKTFLDTFKRYGIDMNSVYIHRAGNLKTGTTAEKKARIIAKYLDTGVYGRVRLYDDAKSNLDGFLNMRPGYDGIDFEAYLVKQGGKIHRYDT